MIAVFRVFLILACAASLWVTWTVNTPRSYAVFELPDGKGTLVFRSWWGWVEEGNFDFLLRTERNVLESGPIFALPFIDPRLNIYATADGSLAMLGTANSNKFVVFDKDGVASLGREASFDAAGSARWTYLGAFARERNARVNFYAPNALPECIALLGDLTGPYRPDQQDNRCEMPDS